MSIESMKARYTELCARRDAVNKQNEPLEEKLDAQNAVVTKEQTKAHAIAAEIDVNRGGEEWLALKKELGMLARALTGGR